MVCAGDREEKTSFPDVAQTKVVIESISGIEKVTPHLDNRHYVFGEVVEGMDVIARIAKTKTTTGDRPAKDGVIQSVTIEHKCALIPPQFHASIPADPSASRYETATR